MFTPADRESLRDALVAAARDDPRIGAAALTGSAALGREDRWSDIDLALSVGDPGEVDAVVEDWSARMRDEHGAVDHVDVWLGATLFRVFLLPSTLQVDIAFWPTAEFGATGPSFRLLFGTANERPPAELGGAFRAVTAGLLAETRQVDEGLADRLAAPLAELADRP